MDLLDDAELLSGAGRRARAYSAAVLAIEEFGKAAGLLALAVMPDGLREGDQLKQAGGRLMAVVHFGPPGLPAKLAALQDSELARILTMTEALAQDADWLKPRGLYVDMDNHGWIRRPSEVTDLEVAEQLAWARQAAWSASLLRDPGDRAGPAIRRPRRSSSHGRWSARSPKPGMLVVPELPRPRCWRQCASSGSTWRHQMRTPGRGREQQADAGTTNNSGSRAITGP